MRLGLEISAKLELSRNAVFQDEFFCSFDGDVSKKLWGKGDKICPHATVFYDGGDPPPTGMHTVVPLILVYRPLSYYLPERQISEKTACMRECRAAPTPPGLATVAFWPKTAPERVTYVSVDPARECLPMRLMLEISGRLRYDLSIEYRRNEIDLWVPAGWNLKKLGGNGKLRETCDAHLLECGINRPLRREDFEITFPYGACVDEFRGGAQKTYLVLKDGQPRYLSGDEVDMRKYDELMHPKSWTSWLLPWIASTACGGLLLFLAVFMMRKAASKRKA